MKFIRNEELKKGMRLGRPVYNKSGVLLYDINTKLTRQGVNSIKNFGLLGVYILEPTEPAQEMSEEDREFERFQAMSVLALKEQLDMIIDHKGAHSLIKKESVVGSQQVGWESRAEWNRLCSYSSLSLVSTSPL